MYGRWVERTYFKYICVGVCGGGGNRRSGGGWWRRKYVKIKQNRHHTQMPRMACWGLRRVVDELCTSEVQSKKQKNATYWGIKVLYTHCRKYGNYKYKEENKYPCFHCPDVTTLVIFTYFLPVLFVWICNTYWQYWDRSRHVIYIPLFSSLFIRLSWPFSYSIK